MKAIVISKLMDYFRYNTGVDCGVDIVPLNGRLQQVATIISDFRHVNGRTIRNTTPIVSAQILDEFTDDQLVTIFELTIRATYTQR